MPLSEQNPTSESSKPFSPQGDTNGDVSAEVFSAGGGTTAGNEIRRPSPRNRQKGLSYKFQRLRERIRQAVASGELSGKLPGERTLARKFHVNAKTLSKALTDLAAEGVLDRSIGRGTYVKGSAPAPTATKRWLVLADPARAESPIIQQLRKTHDELDVATDITMMRPSFLNQFSAVIDFASNTPDLFLRDLVVRNIPVVAIGRECKTFSTHAVLVDAPLAAAHLGRDLLLAGHRRIACVEERGSISVTAALRTIAARYDTNATVDSCYPGDLPAMIEAGVTAIVCASPELANLARGTLARLNLETPTHVSITAIGCISGQAPCSGYFVEQAPVVEAVLHLLADTATTRPATLWLTAAYIEAGTVATMAAPMTIEAAPLRFPAVPA